MVKNFTIVRYDDKGRDQFYDPTTGEFHDDIPIFGMESRDEAEDKMFSLEKDSDYQYAVERVS
jgi:hypothetical protein